jgi:CRP/FNR family transcriptional regulator, anaerobic regulatory protein
MTTLKNIFEPFHLSDEAEKLFFSKFKTKKWKKNAFLLKKGHIAYEVHFLLKGAARCYYEENGKEIVAFFAFEGESISSTLSFMTQTPSDEVVQLLENAEIATISYNDLELLYAQNHEICNMGRKFVEMLCLELEERLRTLQFKSAQERYAYVLEQNPQIIQRVSSIHLSSFLGISPETLSRIRGK